eukprot:scaffold24215_cov129-Isochrysis_galbana.AAC.6
MLLCACDCVCIDCVLNLCIKYKVYYRLAGLGLAVCACAWLARDGGGTTRWSRGVLRATTDTGPLGTGCSRSLDPRVCARARPQPQRPQQHHALRTARPRGRPRRAVRQASLERRAPYARAVTA